MTQNHSYKVDLNWDSDRKGTLSSPVLNQVVEVATPPEFPKGMEGIWSPEHLFVASISSCLMTTFLAIAEMSKLEFSEFEVSAVGKLEKKDGKYWVSEIELRPVVTIENENQRDRAERILHKSESNCLISNSILSEIIFKPKVVVTELVE